MSRLIEIYGLDRTCRLDENSLPLVIGADDDAHVRLAGGQGVAAYVGESRNHLFLQPAEGWPGQSVYHNDEPLTGSVWLKSGDTTRIGETLIQWHLSGRRIEVRVAKASARPLQPPTEPPVSPRETSAELTPRESLPPEPDAPRQSHRLRMIVIGLFVALLAGVAFVLLASPLAVVVTPTPESLSVSGFPPVVKFGDRYLGLPGSYTLHAEKAGYRPLAETVEHSASGSSYRFTLEKLPGLLDVTSTPLGVTLLVDGVPAGETPLRELEVSAGSRLLRFEHRRYQPLEKSLEVEGFGARQSLQVELEPAWAMVSVQTEPAGATVTVDSEEQGETPLELELIAGPRRLMFSKAKFQPLEIELVVEPGQAQAPPAYRLEPAPAMLAVSSVPPGATVATDGLFRGQTPLTLSLPPAEAHTLRLSAAGYLPVSRTLKLEPEEQRELAVTLEPEFGTVFIATIPADAALAIDGKKQERSAGRFRLTTRAHTIEVSAPGYQSVTRSITPQAGYSQRVEISLAASSAAALAPPAPVLTPRKTTGVGQDLVLVEPQPFLMGASSKEPGRRANESEHPVVLKRGFYLSAREVTNREFRQFRAQHASGVAGNRSLEIDSHPVVNVSWDDAARFLNWLSEKDGLPPFYQEVNGAMRAMAAAGTGYRLPTEAEWEFVARVAGRKESVRYPWAGRYPPKQTVGNFADESARHLLPVVIGDYNDSFPASAPVGSFAANPLGVYDLGGNVAEWCHDYYAAYTGQPAGGEVDPMGPPSGTHHIVRGSSWRDASITELRFSYRRYSREPANDIGFRIARYAR